MKPRIKLKTDYDLHTCVPRLFLPRCYKNYAFLYQYLLKNTLKNPSESNTKPNTLPTTCSKTVYVLGSGTGQKLPVVQKYVLEGVILFNAIHILLNRN